MVSVYDTLYGTPLMFAITCEPSRPVSQATLPHHNDVQLRLFTAMKTGKAKGAEHKAQQVVCVEMLSV